jgi:hypothetical protein
VGSPFFKSTDSWLKQAPAFELSVQSIYLDSYISV